MCMLYFYLFYPMKLLLHVRTVALGLVVFPLSDLFSLVCYVHVGQTTPKHSRQLLLWQKPFAVHDFTNSVVGYIFNLEALYI